MLKMANQRGGASQSALGAVVALAFIVLCGVFGYLYLTKDSGKQTQKNQAAPRDQSREAAGPVDNKQAKGVVEIRFYTSSAKKSWVEKAVNAFHAGHPTVHGKDVKVQFFHVLSGDSMEDLKAGRINADIWSPGDESWLIMANEYWQDSKGKPLFEQSVPLLNVPLVIAMWEPMAMALGYPGPVGWSDLVKLARDPRGWGSVGRPEWGQFRWGHAHPDANSGFLAVVSLLYAATGKSTDLTPEDFNRKEVAAFLKDAEGSVEHYGLSNDFIDQLMHSRGPAYLSAAVQYENTIIETNEKHKNQPFKLVAIYPKEGAVWTQHPAAIIKESWMTPEKERACTMFLEFLLSERVQTMAMELGLRPVSPSVRLSAPFDHDHGATDQVPGIPSFTVPNQRVLQRIRDLWEDVKLPATVFVVIDRSASMSGEPMNKAKEGAMGFLKSMKARDQLELVVFNQSPSILVPACLIKDCGEQSLTKLYGIFAEGSTALYDTVMMCLQKLEGLKKSAPHRRYGMIVLSDGQDTSSRTKVHDFFDALPKPEQVDSPKVFTIAYGPEADKQVLSRVSGRTNARMFVGTPKDIMKIYQELSANF